MVSRPRFLSSAPRNALAFAVGAALFWCGLPAIGAPDPAPEPGPSPAGEASASFSLDDIGVPEFGGAAVASAGNDLLFLEVYFGDRPTGRMIDVRVGGSRVSAKPDDLRALGLIIDPSLNADAEGRIDLDRLPGLAYRYEQSTQRLVLDVPPTLRPQQNLGYEAPAPVRVDRGNGLLVNYDAYARRIGDVETLSVASMLRWFGDAGAVELSGVSSTGDDGQSDSYRRLDTRWSYSDPGRLLTWTAGDLISGGLAWTRPVRLGGIQLRRNFGTRPDLITFPIPRFAGQATLPSSVELLVNNVRQYGSDIDDGPFVLDAFPRINGSGEATLVVRDALGRTTQTSVPIYIDQQRLAPGLSDFSFEAGSLRHGYATDKDDYDSGIAASGSYRLGISDSFTGEVHAEYGAGIRVAGAGGVWAPAGRLGLLTGSVAQSSGIGDGSQRTYGYQWMTSRGGFDLYSQRRSRGYRDLGDIVDERILEDDFVPVSVRSQDRASAWLTVPNGSVAVSWLRWRDNEGLEDRIGTLSWSQTVAGNAYLSLSYFDSAKSGSGFGLTLSVPWGEQRDAAVSINHSNGREEITGAARQTAPYEGGWGWVVQGGDRSGGYAQAQADVRGRYGEASFGADHIEGHTGYFAQGNGSVVVMGGTGFVSRRINDSFAVVSSNGVANVPIQYENRLYGHTNSEGFLLLPDMRGWEHNRIAIDPDTLGADYRLPVLVQDVTPSDSGGVLVNFAVSRIHPAWVTLLGRDGRPVAAGSEGRGGDDNRPFIVGLDGEAYLDDYAPGAVLQVANNGTVCRYRLPDTISDGGVAHLGSLPCEEKL
ncbi:fimbrial biogenesis outer membrane usher protein [Lysobacter arenosi]|uniref:Fimbrial biogenesis outer membrane usher protein n=1 Tax=Lysobacter arenosi TaxID=2795387 RepID=A0ABX7RA21_9GAMM|nr:fimbria/pilus outer membrane usher protein [Lysobacter arenosi]QSX74166.1 fimbrial biogenesis outer membrane usher protein [Lysobacter arenosi]